MERLSRYHHYHHLQQDLLEPLGLRDPQELVLLVLVEQLDQLARLLAEMQELLVRRHLDQLVALLQADLLVDR